MSKLKIWDSPTRLFHWMLVLAVAFLWYSGETGDALDQHMMVGTAMLALILYRIVWGYVGSTTARFHSFINLRGALEHLRLLFNREREVHAGHNPLGGLMVLALIVVLLIQSVSGLFTTDDVLTEGPLYGIVDSDLADIMGRIHHLNFTLLQVLAFLHIAAIAFYLFYKKTNLVRPMINGVVNWPDGKKEPELRFVSAFLALAIFASLYGLTRWVLSVLGG